MDALQQGFGILLVVGFLGGVLWLLRRKGVAQFAIRGRAGKARAMKLIERLPLTPQHTLHLVELEGRGVLIATSPGGCSILDRTLEPQRKGDTVR